MKDNNIINLTGLSKKAPQGMNQRPDIYNLLVGNLFREIWHTNRWIFECNISITVEY